MSDIAKVALCLAIPFIGTTLGAVTVFFVKDQMNRKFQRALIGFAAGVMMAASIWSLILPSIEMAKAQGTVEWVPALVGFLAGIAFLLLLDTVIPHLHVTATKPEGGVNKERTGLTKSLMLVFAVTLHNIPEGMAVGVVLAGMLEGSTVITAAGALSLAIGIAVQNFPEGATVSAPLVTHGVKKPKAFLYGMLSGIVEPIAALITIFLTGLVTPILPYILSFAAGAMIYVVVEELIPDAQEGEHSNIGTIGVALGFALMMVLDMALG